MKPEWKKKITLAFWIFSGILMTALSVSTALQQIGKTSVLSPSETVSQSKVTILEKSAADPETQNQTSTIPSPKKAIKKTVPKVTILFVGDIMLGRGVETYRKKYGEDYPFEKISSFLETFDIVFANLEGPIVTNHRKTPDWNTNFSFDSSVAKLLKKHSINIVSLANNHTLDRGAQGFEDTRKYLSEVGIESMGHPKEAREQYVLSKNINGLKMVFLGFQTVIGKWPEEEAYNFVEKEAQDKDSFIIVTMHFGTEYQGKANKTQEKIAHEFIDRGADLIIGHHPHVVQNIEKYQDRLIVYSLGNFIFDQWFSKETQEGLGVELELKEETANYHLYPFKSKKSQVERMEANEAALWLKELATRSDSIAAEVETGIIETRWNKKAPNH